ncbi:MAG: hypothetical protein KAT32_02560 [Candidatus Moranbacteria bacterium]|nr:hypothetical protein [Candidatus Moranbacteria bacterium]
MFQFILTLMFIFAIIFSIFALISFLLYKLGKKINKKVGVFLALTSIIVFCYFTYTAFFPTDSFYEDEFKSIVGLDFPNSGKIIEQSATYPDFHGDYHSNFTVKLSKNDFTELLNFIKNDEYFSYEEKGLEKSCYKDMKTVFYASHSAIGEGDVMQFCEDLETVIISKSRY